MTAVLPEAVRAAKTPIEVWHQDEARVGQQGTLTYVWADKGSRPAALRDQRRQSAYLFGAVCADRGVGAALVLPHANAEAMGLHLVEISRHVAKDAHAVVVLDGAGWHQTGGRLRVARQHQPVAAATVFTGTEPAGKRVAIPTTEPAFKPCVRQLRRHCRGVLHRLERPYGHARPHPLYCHPSLD